MTTKQIKKELIDYNRQFKKNMGGFKSFEIVFDYINFLTSEPYIVNVLKPLIDYIDKESAILDKQSEDDFNNIVIDFTTPNGLTKIPIFKDKFKVWQEDFNNKKESNIMEGLPLCFTLLSAVFFMIQEIKDCQKAGDVENVKRLIEAVKEKSLSVVDTSNIKGYEMKRMTYGQHLDSSMELVNKLIIDEIDSEALLDNEKPKSPLSFDSDKSRLYIRGQKIEITLKNERPIDHYILKAIFANNDFDDQTSFMEIAEDFRNVEYDGENDWPTYRHACDNLNEKIAKATDNKIIGFIYHTNGKTGWCKIDQKYL